MGGGGAERQLAYLCGALPGLGWEVHVAMLHGGIHLNRLEKSGATIHRMRVSGNYDPRLLNEIAHAIDKVKPDVVQTWVPQMDIAGGAMATMKSIPWILSERASSADYLSAPKRVLRRAVATRAAAIVANSEAGARHWAPLRPRVPQFVVRNALPLEEIAATPHADLGKYRRGGVGKLILAAGRYEDQKNYITFVRALSVVFERCDAVALLCGAGPKAHEIRAAIDKAKFGERVIMTGFVDGLWSWMKAADLFVSISHFEGSPNTVMEAAACGLPLVLSDIPEHRELLDDSGAFFVDRTNVSAIAGAIVTAIEDGEVAAGRAANAARAAQQWTIPAMAAQYAAIYERIASRN